MPLQRGNLIAKVHQFWKVADWLAEAGSQTPALSSAPVFEPVIFPSESPAEHAE
jgi:hypothetical protein